MIHLNKNIITGIFLSYTILLLFKGRLVQTESDDLNTNDKTDPVPCGKILDKNSLHKLYSTNPSTINLPSENYCTITEDAFSSYTNLTKLNLQKNRFIDFPPNMLIHNTKLTDLDLSHNNITNFNLLGKLEKTVNVLLEGNPIKVINCSDSRFRIDLCNISLTTPSVKDEIDERVTVSLTTPSVKVEIDERVTVSLTAPSRKKEIDERFTEKKKKIDEINTLLKNGPSISTEKRKNANNKLKSLLDDLKNSSQSDLVVEKGIMDALNTLVDFPTENVEDANMIVALKETENLLDKVMVDLPFTGSNKTLVRSNFAFGFLNASHFPASKNYSMQMRISRDGISDVLTKPSKYESQAQNSPEEVYIQLPLEAVKASGGDKIAFRALRSSSLFITNDNSSVVVSSVLSALLNRPVNGLMSPVLIGLRITENSTKEPSSISCRYWRESTRDWAGDGCVKQYTTEDGMVVCACTHLTNFALLMDVYGNADFLQQFSLVFTIITYIGCCLSLIGLLITIITYGLLISGAPFIAGLKAVRLFRKEVSTKILLNLSTALFLANLVFVAGSWYPNDDAACKVIAVLLQFLFLSVMFWSGVEAVYLYLSCIKVLGVSYSMFMVKAAAVAWGCPLVIIIIVLSINVDNYSHNYICWLTRLPFYVSFLLPIYVVLLFNLIIFALVIYRLIRKNPSKSYTDVSNKPVKNGNSKDKKNKEVPPKERTSSDYQSGSLTIVDSSKAQDPDNNSEMDKSKSSRKGSSASSVSSRYTLRDRIRATVGLCVLLGLTWIFAALAVEKEAAVVFQIIFALCNSLQGFFIFIFHCVLKKDIRHFWKYLCCCQERNDTLSSQGVPPKSRSKNSQKQSNSRSDSGIASTNRVKYSASQQNSFPSNGFKSDYETDIENQHEDPIHFNAPPKRCSTISKQTTISVLPDDAL